MSHIESDWKSEEEPREPLREPLSSLTMELSRVSAEIQSISAGFQSQFLHALADMQRAMEVEFRARLEREIEATRQELLGRVEEVRKEIDRVTGLLKDVNSEIAAMIDDPDAELSRVMRKRAEESVLHSYLDGLKFAAGDPR